MGCPIINYVRPCEPGRYVKNSCLHFVCCVHRKLTVPNSPTFIGCRCTYTSTSTESMSLFIIMNNEELFKPGSMRPAWRHVRNPSVHLCLLCPQKSYNQHNMYQRFIIASGKSAKERAARVRACNYIKFKTRRNLPRVLKIVTRPVHAALT